jgi:hypothetical protein
MTHRYSDKEGKESVYFGQDDFQVPGKNADDNNFDPDLTANG